MQRLPSRTAVLSLAAPACVRLPAAAAGKMDAKSVVAVLTFSVSSSGLLLTNKLCLKEVPLPSFLAVLQFVASVLCALGLAATGQAELDGLQWARVRIYLMYIGLFATAIYSNMQALTHSNVETLIVFRACGPLLVAVLEWRLLGRTLPSRRSALALLGVFFFALGYVASDRAFGARRALCSHAAPSAHMPALVAHRRLCASCSDARAARVLVVRRVLSVDLPERHVRQAPHLRAAVALHVGPCALHQPARHARHVHVRHAQGVAADRSRVDTARPAHGATVRQRLPPAREFPEASPRPPLARRFGVVGGEGPRLVEAEWRQRGVALYALSCVFGIAISFTGWRCRALVSATCYTVLGVANKMLTVLANVIVWDDHASPAPARVQKRPACGPARPRSCTPPPGHGHLPPPLCQPRNVAAAAPLPALAHLPRISHASSALTAALASALQAGLACLVGCLCCATAYRPAPLRRTEHEHEQASTPPGLPPPASRHAPVTHPTAARTPPHLGTPLRAQELGDLDDLDGRSKASKI